uniref:acrosin inhibitor 1-like n=1 Tax=Styela clava TaxID=7725 RepID=UPI001939FA99|nr:acrosin inhibitor 1-like [Styela clava]
MKYVLCIVLLTVFLAVSCSSERFSCSGKTRGCTRELMPVCVRTKDGNLKTFNNKCMYCDEKGINEVVFTPGKCK